MGCCLGGNHHPAHRMADPRDADRAPKRLYDLRERFGMGSCDDGLAQAILWLWLAAVAHAKHIDGENCFTLTSEPAGEAVALIGKNRVPVEPPVSTAMECENQMERSLWHIIGQVQRRSDMGWFSQPSSGGDIQHHVG